MASHGVARASSIQGQKSEKEKQKELCEIEEYKNSIASVEKCMDAHEHNYETLGLINVLLKKNPEYYTMWNNRRRVLESIFAEKMAEDAGDQASQRIEELIHSDLEFLLPLLIKFPKCYWIWNHRSWLLQQTSVYLSRQTSYKFWQHELDLVAQMFRRDNRNFHGWNYRRRVIAALREFDRAKETVSNDDTAEEEASLTEEEFAFTTTLVRTNLSNFSAWHNRSQLIPRLLDERKADRIQRRRLFERELAFINEALSMDPNDQSLWYYHHFLISNLTTQSDTCFGRFTEDEQLKVLQGQLELFREVLDDYEDCKWIYQNLLYFAEESLKASRNADFISTREMQLWLNQLKILDPQRSGRWASWETRLPLS